jgi:hypothetical protein
MDRKIFEKITIFLTIFEFFLEFFFFFKWGPGQIQPSHLGGARIGPAQSGKLIIWSLHAEFILHAATAAVNNGDG